MREPKETVLHFNCTFSPLVLQYRSALQAACLLSVICLSLKRQPRSSLPALPPLTVPPKAPDPPATVGAWVAFPGKPPPCHRTSSRHTLHSLSSATADRRFQVWPERLSATTTHRIPRTPMAPVAHMRIFLNTLSAPSFSVDKFCLSPFAKLNDAGQYAPSISIRRGQGRASHDRVVRFLPSFATSDEALRYAADHGRRFVQQTSCPA